MPPQLLDGSEFRSKSSLAQLQGTVIDMKKILLLAMASVKAFFEGVTWAPETCLQEHRFDNSLRLQRMRWVLVAVVTAAMATTVPASAADNASAQVAVGATVLRYSSVNVLTAPRMVNISKANIALGYVDVTTTSKLEIRSNSPTGYALAIESQADFARGTEVRGAGGVAALGRFGGMLNIHTVGHGMQTTPVELSFRVLLSEEARPGVFPWALHISVLPV